MLCFLLSFCKKDNTKPPQLSDDICEIVSTPNTFEIPGKTVFIPNVITPNGDGVNDIISIRGLESSDLTRIDFILYNRFKHEIYRKNFLDGFWDLYFSKSFIDNKYYYKASIVFSDNSVKEVEGVFVVLGHYVNTKEPYVKSDYFNLSSCEIKCEKGLQPEYLSDKLLECK